MQLTPQTVSRMSAGQPAWPSNVVSQVRFSILFVWCKHNLLFFKLATYTNCNCACIKQVILNG